MRSEYHFVIRAISNEMDQEDIRNSSLYINDSLCVGLTKFSRYVKSNKVSVFCTTLHTNILLVVFCLFDSSLYKLII